jgi:hypothetical protein
MSRHPRDVQQEGRQDADRRPRSDPVAKLLDQLQLGSCARCGRVRYFSRREARYAARIASPGTRLRAYRCGTFWHLGTPEGRNHRTDGAAWAGYLQVRRGSALTWGIESSVHRGSARRPGGTANGGGGMRIAFYGRTATADGAQTTLLRQRQVCQAMVAPHEQITAVFFDVGAL